MWGHRGLYGYALNFYAAEFPGAELEILLRRNSSQRLFRRLGSLGAELLGFLNTAVGSPAVDPLENRGEILALCRVVVLCSGLVSWVSAAPGLGTADPGPMLSIGCGLAMACPMIEEEKPI